MGKGAALIDLPKRGDRVRLRGRPHTGWLRKMDDETKWATVEWDKGGPKICHLHELEKVAMING